MVASLGMYLTIGVTPQGGVRCSSLRPGGYKTLRLFKVWDYNCSIVHNFDFARFAIGDAAVGEFGEGFFGFGTLFGVADALQVAGCEGFHGGL